MSRVEELCFEARRMELQEEEEEEEEDFYPYEFDAEEELPAYRDGDELLAALRRKEEEVLLAAQLGKALLLENRQLKEERVKLHEQYTDQVEELEQARHELRLKLQGCQVQWESQVAELERDVLELRAQVEELTQALSEVEREKSRNQQQHIEISQQLREQLHTAMEVERTVTAELQSLKLELRERGHPRPQDEELLSALREQLTEAWQEVEAARGRVQELQAQLEEMQEEVSLQRSGHGEASLLSEMEHSLDAMGWSQDKEQVTQEVTSILDMLLPVACGSEALRDEDGILQSMLGQLKSVAERIAHSQTLQELKQPIVEVGSVQCEKTALLQELRDQNARLLEENAELRLKADSRLDEEIVQRAIKDRDDAIAKKTAVEAELVRSKNDIMCLNNQLLEAIQRKLELSQELEAWQDDIQIIINQQLKSQHQTEQQSDRKRSGAGRLSFLRKSRKPSASPSCTPEISPAPNQSPWRDWLKLSK
uniref:Si:ch211-235m3.5 n=1 Tax=Pygocentrus nattereri TaxID=42514 RepID=A0AAR2K805_PYGNA